MAFLAWNAYLLCGFLFSFYHMLVSGCTTSKTYIRNTIPYFLHLLFVGCKQWQMPGMQKTITGIMALVIKTHVPGLRPYFTDEKKGSRKRYIVILKVSLFKTNFKNITLLLLAVTIPICSKIL